MTETYRSHGELVDAIILAASASGLARLFKNQSGVARHHDKGTGKVHYTRYGVGPKGGGGHDLIGWRMDGRFVSIDAKIGRDVMSEDQLKWQRWVIAGGGISGEARSVDDAMNLITEGGKWPAGRSLMTHGSMRETIATRCGERTGD